LLLDSTYAEASHNIGVVHSLEARHEEAQLYFEKAVKWKPDYALAHKNLANNHLVQGDYQAAIEVFQLAIGLDPNMAEAYNGLGTALIQQGDISEGKAARARAIELGTED
jgi:protein O-GlcNAc transferase